MSAATLEQPTTDTHAADGPLMHWLCGCVNPPERVTDTAACGLQLGRRRPETAERSPAKPRRCVMCVECQPMHVGHEGAIP